MPQKYGGKLQAAALPDKTATLKCIGAMIAQPIGELFTVCCFWFHQANHWD